MTNQANVKQLLTDNLDIWLSAETEKKSGRGRASGNKGTVYGVQKLRELILELAVRGKLVLQDANDVPASELIKNIFITRDTLIKNKGLKTVACEVFKQQEIYIQVPNSWAFCRLGNLAKFIDYRGKTPNKVTSGVPLITAKNVRQGYISREPEEYVTPEEYASWMTRGFPRVGDMLFTTEAPLGNIALIDISEKFALAQRVICFQLHNQAIGNYLKIALMSKQVQQQFENEATGMTATGIKASNLKEIPIPIPPLAEQRRIVAKVDELMALCDQLEQQHSNAQKAHETLVKFVLSTLTQSQNAIEFQSNWQRIAAHFETLFTTQASIDALKQTLLQLAVMGKLVPQDPFDEPASELLKRIQAEKAKLIAEGKLKKEKPLAPIVEEEKPFELPKGWEWSKVLNCSVFVTDGEHATPQRSSDGKIPLVTAKNVRDGYMDYEDTDFVDISVAEKCWKRYKPEQADLLMVSVGATLGRLTLLEEARDMVIVRSVTLIRPCLLSPLYLSLAIKSPFVQQAIWGSVRQMAQPGLYLAQSSNLVIPIPPLTEQNRIVAKVDALMALCDQLSTRIQQASKQQQLIANALVAQALKPAIAEIIDLASYRAAIVCYAINKMQNSAAFGRTQAMKVLYLSQHHLGLEMNLQFEREAAGPFTKWIYEFERQSEQANWFAVVKKPISDSKTKVQYQIKSGITKPLALIETLCSSGQRKELDRILVLFADRNTEEAEIIATLFAVWNDFLIDSITPNDAQIIKEVRENWHESKARFSPLELTKWLDWMRSKHLVPKGRLPHTAYQQSLIN